MMTILMATYNGAPHLPKQLASIAAQRDVDWTLWVSDDGSEDATLDIIERFARDHRVRIFAGPKRGAAANFLSLLDRTHEAEGPVAFSDQDDIWHPMKLARAADALAIARGPAIYAAQSIHIDVSGRELGRSVLTPRGPSFQNALVQNILSGHSIAMNTVACEILRSLGQPNGIASHDWWLYQLMTGIGAHVVIDPKAVLYYRQHDQNLRGSFHGPKAQLSRLSALASGEFGIWVNANLAALDKVAPILQPAVRDMVRMLLSTPTGPERAGLMRSYDIHRQRALDTFAVRMAARFGRL